MANNSFLSFLFLFAFILANTGMVYSQMEPLYLKGGSYYDVNKTTMVKNEGIIIAGGKFLQLDITLKENKLSDYKVIQLTDDQYILPGIVDLHAHYRMAAFGDEERQWIDEFKYNAIVYLANGVTSTFPAGVFHPYMELAAKKRINSGEQIGPRIWAAGPYFGSARPGWDEDFTAEDIYRQVDYWAGMGVDGFKSKGGSPEMIKHLVKRAHQHGLTVTGHLGSGSRSSTNSIDAIDMGIDRIEHILGGFVLDSTKSAYPVWNKVDTSSSGFRKTADYFIDHKIYFDGTLIAPVYFTSLKDGFEYWTDEKEMFTPFVRNLLPPRDEQESSDLMDGLYNAMQRSTKAFYDAGGGDLLTLGTDAPSHGYFLAGFSAHREMHTMTMAGIPPEAVLKIATINGANAIGKGNLLGSIETGKLADFFIINGNPLNDITNTRKVEWVGKAGRVYDSGNLLDSVKGKIGPADEQEVSDWYKYPEIMEIAEELEQK